MRDYMYNRVKVCTSASAIVFAPLHSRRLSYVTFLKELINLQAWYISSQRRVRSDSLSVIFGAFNKYLANQPSNQAKPHARSHDVRATASYSRVVNFSLFDLLGISCGICVCACARFCRTMSATRNHKPCIQQILSSQICKSSERACQAIHTGMCELSNALTTDDGRRTGKLSQLSTLSSISCAIYLNVVRIQTQTR